MVFGPFYIRDTYVVCVYTNNYCLYIYTWGVRVKPGLVMSFQVNEGVKPIDISRQFKHSTVMRLLAFNGANVLKKPVCSRMTILVKVRAKRVKPVPNCVWIRWSAVATP